MISRPSKSVRKLSTEGSRQAPYSDDSSSTGNSSPSNSPCAISSTGSASTSSSALANNTGVLTDKCPGKATAA